MDHHRRRRFARSGAVAAAITCGLGASPTAVAATPESVHVWLTTPDLQSALTQQPDITLGAPKQGDLSVDTSARYQRIDGFGAAFTETSTTLLTNSLSSTDRDRVMRGL